MGRDTGLSQVVRQKQPRPSGFTRASKVACAARGPLKAVFCTGYPCSIPPATPFKN